ncbi:MAG: hypothetical protein J5858_16385 [Lentisphaeria bacterium]|nr:hypothetical protein [Lentisphaeria bacterium]
MKKMLVVSMIAGLALSNFAAEKIYRGNSKDAKDIICYYQGQRFYSDAARKNPIYHHPGNMVSKDAKATAKNSIYRLMGDRIYKGYSLAKPDCIATIFETKTKRGDALSAKIFDGFIIVREVVKSTDKKTKSEVVTSYKVTADGINEIQPKVLFTIDNNKIYRGDSTNDKDCVLTFTGSFPASRLLFMAIELTKTK